MITRTLTHMVLLLKNMKHVPPLKNSLSIFLRCSTIVRLFEDAMKVVVDKDTCKDCGSQLVTAEYKRVFKLIFKS